MDKLLLDSKLRQLVISAFKAREALIEPYPSIDELDRINDKLNYEIVGIKNWVVAGGPSDEFEDSPCANCSDRLDDIEDACQNCRLKHEQV